MDFFFQNEQQKPPAQAAGTAATPPRPVLRPLKKPGTSVTSADEAESGGAKGAESTAGSKKGIVSRHSLKFETLHKEKAQEAEDSATHEHALRTASRRRDFCRWALLGVS